MLPDDDFKKEYESIWTPVKSTTLQRNNEPINERKYNLVEVLIEIESNKNVPRIFRKSNSDSFVHTLNRNSNFEIKISLQFECDSLENNWYEVDKLWNLV